MTQNLKIITLLSFVAMQTPILYAAPASNLYNTTFSILAYAKWQASTPKLCVVNQDNIAQQFKKHAPLHNKYDIQPIQSHEISKMEQVTFKVLCAHHACDYFKANM